MNNAASPTLASSTSDKTDPQGASRRSAQGTHLRGILYCLAATVSFGLMFPVMSSALTHIDPFTFTSLRYLIAAVVSLVLLRVTEGPDALRLKGEQIALAWFLGSIGFAGFGFLVFLGQQLGGRDGALTTSIMAATQPLLGVLIISITRRVLPPIPTLLLVLLSFCGVALVITKGDIGGLLREPQNYSANGLIVLGMILWLIYTFGAARFVHWSALKYTTMTMVLGLSTIIAINAILVLTDTIVLPGTADALFILPHLLYMSLISSVVGVLCWNLGNRILTPLNGVLFMDVVPITAFTVSAMTGVLPTRVQIIGACITGGALILNNLYLRRRS
ncbi:DMT family transporter [Bradyrhizobium macuxiense]|nr:DMT family transporter [Bradyrhizobium macuxiense]